MNVKQKDEKSGQWLLSGQINEHEPIRQYTIHNDVFSVGRRSGSSLCLPVGCVSKNHAEIELVNGHLILRDLGSTNGTYINGSQLNGEAEVSDGDLLQFATIVFRVGRQKQATDVHTVHEDACDHALAMVQFDKLVNDGGFIPYFQPIVSMQDKSVMGYEVLGRSRLFGLQSPVEMFTAASQLNLEAQLSETFRRRGVEIGRSFGPDANLFLNTHPKELGLEQLYASLEELREYTDQIITLEIHENAVTDPDMMRKLCSVLKDLDIRLAFDDFGVGEARLVELGEFRPDYLKFDMEFTKNIDQATPKHQQVVTLFAKLVTELGIKPLAEGIENEESHQILTDMGFVLGQGFYYGKPQPISRYV